MTRYKDIPMSQRMEKVGELLAKGIYLYIQKQKETGDVIIDKENKAEEQNSL